MPQKEKTRRNPLVFWGVMAALAILVILGVRWLTRERVGIRTAFVSRQSLDSSTSTNGKVEPIREYQAHAASPGVIKSLYVSVGDKVSVGELLVTMDDSDIRARLASSAASISSAKIGLDTTQGNGTQEEKLLLAGDIGPRQVAKAAGRKRSRRDEDATAERFSIGCRGSGRPAAL